MPKSLFVDPVATRAAGSIHFEDIPVCTYNKTVAEERANYSDADLIRIYRDITILREFEHMLTLIKTQANYNGIETTYPGPRPRSCCRCRPGCLQNGWNRQPGWLRGPQTETWA